MRAFCSSHPVSRVGLERAGTGPRSGPWGESAGPMRDEECPGGAAKDQGESISGSRDSENKDGLMSAHFQRVALPSEKAGLLLSALLIGLVNLGSRGLDAAAGRTASVSGVVASSRRSPALSDLYQ